MDLLGIGTAEILVIIIVAILVLGPGKIVGFSRTMGRISRNIKKASADLTSAVTREVDEEERQAQQKKDAGEADKGHKPPPVQTAHPDEPRR